MGLAPRCSEHPYCADGEGSLRGKPLGTKTCSERCKSARARRIKRAKQVSSQNATLPEGMAEVSAVVTAGAKDVVHEVLKEELRPLVREAMTEDLLRGINTMVGLTPRVIELLEQQMESDDEVVAQRAVALHLKYTLGNPSVAPPPTTPQSGGLNVSFLLPRPGDATAPEVEGTVVTEVVRPCSDCGVDKPEAEFVAGAPRCRACFVGLGSMLEERFGEDYTR